MTVTFWGSSTSCSLVTGNPQLGSDFLRLGVRYQWSQIAYTEYTEYICMYTYRFPRTQIQTTTILSLRHLCFWRFTTCWDTDPRVGQGAAPRTCQGRCTAAPLASAQLPSARRIATEQLPTRLAAASAHRRHPPLCPPLCACGPRTRARPHPQPAACGLPRPPAQRLTVARRQDLGELSEAAEAEEEVDLELTLAPIRCLRARAGER